MNGSIHIQVTEPLTYTALITSINYSNSFTFVNEVDIVNLNSGSYEICITVLEIPTYEFCATAIISEPEELIINSIIDASAETATFLLQGGTSYSIRVNSLIYQTMADEITVPLNLKVNRIEISTDKECQGIYEEIITLSDDVIVYPNPFGNAINISLKDRDLGNIKVSFYTETGQLIKSMDVLLINGSITMDASFLSSGFYFIQLDSSTLNKTFKIFKQ